MSEEPLAEPAPEPDRESAPTDWMMLTDPAWTPEDEQSEPPGEVLLGGWPMWPDGSWGRFQANPGYRPMNPDSPSDPVDAVLRLMVRDDYGADALLSVLEDTALEIALDENGVAVVDRAPDGVPSVLVVTAPIHRDRVGADDWRGTHAAEIAEALPETGVDVLLNPNSPASMRLSADALREHLASAPDDAAQGPVRTEIG
ncbi:type VII secretion system-associated protein [Saccharopolyspora sp. NFXS83]|uniref:type VII secretion system-associated protein n=1 Tax=Saccharopolyspora sp. NFXS83 TaxID=2993560 RepID=UPI00224A5CCB|nr:type VII secretion system-associated protein [Saccharopolyspora sp. NFXS83]MCX2731514.1 type VII secretion system-associated protein [Saccharopolyspora sp. NFXS83]